MELRPWQLLPDEMRTKEVRKYYNILILLQQQRQIIQVDTKYQLQHLRGLHFM